jgi:hypothetical protein
MTREDNISVEYLRTRLKYDEKTGNLFWLGCGSMPKKWTARWANKPASSLAGNGYIQIKIGKKSLIAHRVCWALHYGEWPDGSIDHINGIRSDNRIENLRVVSRQTNQRNMKKYSTNKSGIVGVVRDTNRNKWYAYITIGNRKKNIGRFICLGQAIRARKEAEKLYGFHPNHGRR